VLKRLIKKLRRAYPKALILVRADAGFAVPAIMTIWKSSRMSATSSASSPTTAPGKDRRPAGKAQRRYQEREHNSASLLLQLQADSWDQPRRIIAKVEYAHLAPISAS